MGERVSRREFLITAGRSLGGLGLCLSGLDAYLSHKNGQNTPLTAFWEQLETGTLFRRNIFQEVENAFGISFFNPPIPVAVSDIRLRETLGVRAHNRIRDKSAGGKLISWDKPRIAILAKILSQLPENFYDSQQGGVRFVLCQGDFQSRRKIDESDSYRGLCTCEQEGQTWDYLTTTLIEDGFPPVVFFVRRDLRTLYGIDSKSAISLIIHELTHIRTFCNMDSVNGQNPILDGIMASLELPKTIRYDQPDDSLISIFSSHLIKNKLSESDLFGASVIPLELVAIAAESYFRGKADFYQTYLTYLGAARTENLYQYMKDIVFTGREYSQGIWLTN